MDAPRRREMTDCQCASSRTVSGAARERLEEKAGESDFSSPRQGTTRTQATIHCVLSKLHSDVCALAGLKGVSVLEAG